MIRWKDLSSEQQVEFSVRQIIAGVVQSYEGPLLPPLLEAERKDPVRRRQRSFEMETIYRQYAKNQTVPTVEGLVRRAATWVNKPYEEAVAEIGYMVHTLTNPQNN